MVASRCENRFTVLANVYRYLNMEIEQLANLKRTLRILANEWLVQWFQGFENVYCSARQIVPRRGLIVPHEICVKKVTANMMLAYYEFHNFNQIAKPQFTQFSSATKSIVWTTTSHC